MRRPLKEYVGVGYTHGIWGKNEAMGSSVGNWGVSIAATYPPRRWERSMSRRNAYALPSPPLLRGYETPTTFPPPPHPPKDGARSYSPRVGDDEV